MVNKASSLQEAKQILRDYAPTLSRDSISLDSENRVDIFGDIMLHRLFGRRSHKTLPLVFGKITGNFQAVDLGLTTLEGAPYWVGEAFAVSNNNLTTLTGGPEYVGTYYFVTKNPLENLDGLASHIGNGVEFDYTPTLPLLRTLVAKKIWPTPDQPALESILNKYAGQGRRGMFAAKKELIEAGFSGNARW
jgi:hypothetical protein